jgi:hypothetical protein
MRIAPLANKPSEIVLSMQDLRAVTGYAAESAQDVMAIFEQAHPADSLPRDAVDAVDAAWAFARGQEPRVALDNARPAATAGPGRSLFGAHYIGKERHHEIAAHLGWHQQHQYP